jgi:hypothetical protein
LQPFTKNRVSRGINPDRWTKKCLFSGKSSEKNVQKKIPGIMKMMSMVPKAVPLTLPKSPVPARPGARSCSGQLSNGLRSPAQGWAVTRRPGQPPGLKRGQSGARAFRYRSGRSPFRYRTLFQTLRYIPGPVPDLYGLRLTLTGPGCTTVLQ